MPDTAYFMTLARPTPSATKTLPGETVLLNEVKAKAKLTICVPCYKETADALVTALARMPEANQCALLLFDDGSASERVSRRLSRHVTSWPGPACLVTADANRGRAHARNRLVDLASANWVLFLDADMVPDTTTFLKAYLREAGQCSEPAMIAGGFSLTQIKPTGETALHIAQAARSDCLPAAKRSEHPGRYVFTSNILVHADILDEVGFDDGFTGWGWEDVDWGLNVAAKYPVRHIDNTATHLGLDATDKLIGKFGGSGANFARLVQRHPDEVKTMRLYRMADTFRYLPARGMFRGLTRGMAKSTHLPIGVRLYALKAYRAFEYAEHL